MAEKAMSYCKLVSIELCFSFAKLCVIVMVINRNVLKMNIFFM